MPQEMQPLEEDLQGRGTVGFQVMFWARHDQSKGAEFRVWGEMFSFSWIVWGFLKWWYPTTIGFPTKMIILACFGGTTF